MAQGRLSFRFVHKVLKKNNIHFGEQGMARLPPMWPGFKSCVDAMCGLSLFLVLSLALRGFSLHTLVFPSPEKPTFSNSNSTWN